MKIAIKGLRAKDYTGGIRYYWEPNAIERKAGWKAIILGTDLDGAMKGAKARNDEIDCWRNGGAKPRTIKKIVKAATVSALIARYREDNLDAVDDKGRARYAANTRHTYNTCLRRIEAIFGDISAAAITRKHVRDFRDAMMRPKARGGVGHTTAHGTLRVLRSLYAWAIDVADMDLTNPAINFDLGTPAPRDQMWEPEDTAAFRSAALHLGYPGLAFAVDLAEYIGQRETDLLKLHASQWREINGLDRETRESLASDTGPNAGKVMGIFIRQQKGLRWVGVPVAGTMRERIEAAIAANAARGAEAGAVAVTNLVINDDHGLPWLQRHFIRKFTEVKDLAVAGFTAKDKTKHAPHPALEDLQFRDLRRTAVVRLGELGLEDQLISAITGHKLETVKKILEVYMPRTTKMAARAIVARIGQAKRDDPAKEKKA